MSDKVEAAGYIGFGQGNTASALFAAREIQETVGLVLTEIRRAVEKHGPGSTPLNRNMHFGVKLAILMEEVGEVAEALTYDNPKDRDLGAELVQVATMALAWRASLS